MTNQSKNKNCPVCNNKTFQVYFKDEDDELTKIHDTTFCYLHGLLADGRPLSR